jgi:hypothetical protein
VVVIAGPLVVALEAGEQGVEAVDDLVPVPQATVKPQGLDGVLRGLTRRSVLER